MICIDLEGLCLSYFSQVVVSYVRLNTLLEA